ncbi:hypothetical protein L6164_021388 [Bauhinia variegata]|uniref:Uncharacterized protein n=1 Tax=Bauhinia variegata TaxID=167791 RepID=A0ACB9N1Z8_BAUVA|nr:hypothetical protein L6164_021388 [Bauhinia variegata]
MLITMASSLTFMQRKAMMIFPESMRKLWNNWELQAMVLLSLSFQSFLVFLGTVRKCDSRIWHRIVLWIAYLSADGLATISLSVLSDKVAQIGYNFVEPKVVIMALWAPFLLLHLGGPDTITAYSMEDNEFWLRYLLKFGIQVGVAFYIFLRAWTNAKLNILAIVMFIAGLIKIGERTWVLWSASSERFKQSLFPDPDPGPNYARFMEAHSSASDQGFKVNVQDLIGSPFGDYAEAEDIVLTKTEDDTRRADKIIVLAHKFFETFKRLFADLILSFQDVLESRLSIENGSCKEVFELIEAELGFIYDVFYTKAVLIHSVVGGFLRFISFWCIIIVLCLFFVTEKSEYPKSDLVITYVLLVGAVVLEIYSVISLVFSDWTILRLMKHKNEVTDMMIRVISAARNGKWSNSMAQFNLISFCLKTRNQRFGDCSKKTVAKCCLIRMIMHAYQSYMKFMHGDIESVPEYLKDLIFEQFLKKIEDAKEKLNEERKVAEEVKKFCDHRGDKVLKDSKYSTKSDLKRTVEVELDQSILLWHIATDLCYNSVSDEAVVSSDTASPNYRKASKLLSDYMLYLLVKRPFMLPDGIGEIRFQDTCAEATEFIKAREPLQDDKGAYEMLLEICSDVVDPSAVKGDRSKSVLFDACRLAKTLQKLENEQDWRTQKMWELITDVWLEMLAYAASHCQGIHHAQQLRRGGELLTHVWLLMAHLGITNKIQISDGHRRTKLIRK